jgi:hypothetical protein
VERLGDGEAHRRSRLKNRLSRVLVRVGSADAVGSVEAGAPAVEPHAARRVHRELGEASGAFAVADGWHSAPRRSRTCADDT